MIVKASQRGSGQDLSVHLMREDCNELVEHVETRGAVADSLGPAFEEWELSAKALTRCQKYLYSVSLNPDPEQGPLSREQYMDYIGRAEKVLGLTEQPRAIVFHTKQGREHCHVVWSRIDVEQGKAVHIAFDKEKLTRVTREFAREHGLELPDGYEKRGAAKGGTSLYEEEQRRETGLSKQDHVDEVTAAWRSSDSPKSFVRALRERGYILATGNRPYVLVDSYGGMHSLPKLIDDKQVRTNDIRRFLEKDFPEASLPSVEEAQVHVATLLKKREKEVEERSVAGGLEVLRHLQASRRNAAEHAIAELKTQFASDRQNEAVWQRQQRDALRQSQRDQLRQIRQDRQQNRATGLVGFLGRVSGVESVRKAMARRRDAKHVTGFRDEQRALQRSQAEDAAQKELLRELKLKDAVHALSDLAKLERREVRALAQGAKAAERVRSRERNGMPTLEESPKLVKVQPVADMRSAFDTVTPSKFEKSHQDVNTTPVADIKTTVNSWPTEGNFQQSPANDNGRGGRKR